MMKEHRDSAEVGTGFPAENTTEAQRLGRRQGSFLPFFLMLVLGVLAFALIWWLVTGRKSLSRA
jgi:hypothetical protein